MNTPTWPAWKALHSSAVPRRGHTCPDSNIQGVRSVELGLGPRELRLVGSQRSVT